MKRVGHLNTPRILSAAKAGDRRAIEIVLRQNNGLMHRVIQRFSIPGYEYSDLEQLGRLGLLRAIETFDPAEGCVFSTLATFCIMSPLNHAWAAAARKGRGHGVVTVSLDADNSRAGDDDEYGLLASLIDGAPQPERIVLKRDECRRMLGAILGHVQHQYRDLLIERLSLGDGLAEIAREVGCSRQALEQVVRNMRRAAERNER